jgi:methanogenic corrinoid protein MtbC1
LVYLRAKIVKGEKYLYLVKSVWDPKKNTSKQETIKYLGKSSELTRDDIPPDYRNDPKIISFLASDEMLSVTKKDELLSKIKDQLYRHLIKGDFDGTKQLCDDYSSSSGFVSFFEKILTPVMHHIGEMWQKNKISIADEHVASNVANILVKTIQERNSKLPTKKRVVICVPEGEQHNLGANMIETYLSSLGFKVYNLTPSEPHDSIISFIENIKPDATLVSLILPDSVKPAQRLVRKILQRSDGDVFVGGQGVNERMKFDGAQVMASSMKNLARTLNAKNR